MATADKPKYNVIGTRPVRHDGVDKVTGRAKYGADIRLTGMLHGAMLRSPHAHAKILSIDTSAAEALPGVRAVVTGADFPEQGDRIVELGEGAANMRHLSANVMARDKVLYKGHALAAVAADNIHIASEAVRLIKVEYEKLPPVLDVRKAMQADAPVLNDDIRTESVGSAPATKDSRPTNIAKHFLFEKGDAAAGFAAADLVIEREFDTTMVHQGYIEPHNATVLWNADGKISIWISTQGSFSVRQQTAELLKVPVSSVKVTPMEIGGGFGGKISVYLPPVAAVLSRKTGRPVKIVMSRADVFEATGPTPGSHMKVKLGVTKDGKITAGEAWIAFEAGAYTGSPIGPACMCVFACYDVPAGRVEGFDVCVNKPRTNAYRAPGSTQVAFATESVVDEICVELKMDPAEFRLKNGAKEGVRRIDGPKYARIGMLETVEAIQASEHYNSPLEGKYRGRGIATGFWFNVGMQSSVTATVNYDGVVSLVEGSTDIGGTRTSIAMQLAETLGIAAEAVNPVVVDTDSVGYTDVTGGSRVTFATGIAAVEAAKEIQWQLVDRAAFLWNVDPEKVRYENGGVVGPGDKRMSFQELAGKLHASGGTVTGTGVSSKANQAGAFGTHCVDVEVDPELGKVQILRYTVAQDAGTAIHPSYVEGQMQGGAVQGIGWALNEEYYYGDDGDMKNATYLDYRMPTCYDVPMIETIIVEVPDPQHPYGVRGVGEVPICPPPAAIANAIFQATGVRMRRLPMSPSRLLPEILKASSKSSK
ncbi:xanthine dehydrogenase family protein molybdopterin-binding subunit [Lignipirellula cremea]|uniref:4-hydroxybenzoyl-CoA reductase subunit alpha n=1 Tax=Lignipirellula cremea TaxID=2528010 RepID=A0A518E2P5_9BACT|nr:xanthine dehydrogenase family protein molybdopterin-binding subunit [Lignipirellula cremea]QDU98342.1 4-hydroxybenzoyl-CoA reductase subunit alpha [Lignipirellula cremea]